MPMLWLGPIFKENPNRNQLHLITFFAIFSIQTDFKLLTRNSVQKIETFHLLQSKIPKNK